MKITLFTGNQPRHLRFANELSKICDNLYIIEECCTIFSGEIKDFYDNSNVMKEYFKHVRASERNIFGKVSFLNKNIFQLAIKDGDLNYFSLDDLKPALNSDYYIVYGSSFIKNELADFLISHNAINIHLGISPYYRGNSCNFWALYNHHPEFVGATIMKLSYELDSGLVMFHCFPKPKKCNGFDLGMSAVKAAQDAIVSKIKDNSIFSIKPYNTQNNNKDCYYYRKKDFTDSVAKKYLNSMLSEEEIYYALSNRKLDLFINPVFF